MFYSNGYMYLLTNWDNKLYFKDNYILPRDAVETFAIS